MRVAEFSREATLKKADSKDKERARLKLENQCLQNEVKELKGKVQVHETRLTEISRIHEHHE